MAVGGGDIHSWPAVMLMFSVVASSLLPLLPTFERLLISRHSQKRRQITAVVSLLTHLPSLLVLFSLLLVLKAFVFGDVRLVAVAAETKAGASVWLRITSMCSSSTTASLLVLGIFGALFSFQLLNNSKWNGVGTATERFRVHLIRWFPLFWILLALLVPSDGLAMGSTTSSPMRNTMDTPDSYSSVGELLLNLVSGILLFFTCALLAAGSSNWSSNRGVSPVERYVELNLMRVVRWTLPLMVVALVLSWYGDLRSGHLLVNWLSSPAYLTPVLATILLAVSIMIYRENGGNADWTLHGALLFLLAPLWMAPSLFEGSHFAMTDTLLPLAIESASLNERLAHLLSDSTSFLHFRATSSLLIILLASPLLVLYAPRQEEYSPPGKGRWYAMAILFGICGVVVFSSTYAILSSLPQWDESGALISASSATALLAFISLIGALLPQLGLDEMRRPEVWGWRLTLFILTPLTAVWIPWGFALLPSLMLILVISAYLPSLLERRKEGMGLFERMLYMVAILFGHTVLLFSLKPMLTEGEWLISAVLATFLLSLLPIIMFHRWEHLSKRIVHPSRPNLTGQKWLICCSVFSVLLVGPVLLSWAVKEAPFEWAEYIIVMPILGLVGSGSFSILKRNARTVSEILPYFIISLLALLILLLVISSSPTGKRISVEMGEEQELTDGVSIYLDSMTLNGIFNQTTMMLDGEERVTQSPETVTWLLLLNLEDDKVEKIEVVAINDEGHWRYNTATKFVANGHLTVGIDGWMDGDMLSNITNLDDSPSLNLEVVYHPTVNMLAPLFLLLILSLSYPIGRLFPHTEEEE